MLTKINNQEKKYQLQRFNIKRDKNLEFDFRDFKSLKEIYYWKFLIDRTEVIQKEFAGAFPALEKYKPTKPEYI